MEEKHFNFKHGDRYANNGKQHYLYTTWCNIKARCYNKNRHDYERYGGKGIRMFEEWINNYPKFKEWIVTNLGERPKGMSIDRIKSKGNYVPNNLRWATSKQQNLNRCSVKLTPEQRQEIIQKYIPRKYSLRKLAKEYGVSKSTILNVLKFANPVVRTCN